MRDMVNNKQVVFLGTISTGSESAWVDMRGFDAATIMASAVAADASGTLTLTAQHGDDSTDAGATDILASDSVNGNVTAVLTGPTSAGDIFPGIGYRGSKRYLRVGLVNATATSDVNVYALLNVPHRAATTFVGASVAAT